MKITLNYHFKDLLGAKNLLAFSAGVDSSALFFLLIEQNIDFDVACVNYKTRKNSDKEALHVKNLAKKYGKKSYIFTCKIDDKNFEHNARKIRYEFFEKIIKNNIYHNLLLAHQLDDRFEWFMMQCCKGAGTNELSGFSRKEKRQNYNIIRPLLDIRKKQLLEYLTENNLPYFEDDSNFDIKYRRNYFRKNITSKLLETYENGIKKTLNFMLEDSKVLEGNFLHVEKKLFIYKLQHEKINMRLIDKAMKKLGFIMSENSRIQSLKVNAVINHKIAVGRNELYGFIAPFEKNIMPKKFKEQCRVLKIPLHIRSYLFRENINLSNILTL